MRRRVELLSRAVEGCRGLSSFSVEAVELCLFAILHEAL